MESKLIIYPGFSMIVLTVFLYIKNRLAVVSAIKEKSIHFNYLKAYKESPPEYVDITRQTLKNQFELPVLFYFLITLIFINGHVTFFDLIFAWGFSVSRYIHAYIRLSTNYVPVRAKVFILGVVLLCAGWINFLVNNL